MAGLELSLSIITFIALFAGGWGICWARTHPRRTQAQWGQRLFVITLLGLGASGLVAACARAEGLVPLGLLAGLLLVGMLWENPVSRGMGAPLPAQESPDLPAN
jgi:hypothetical protein